VTTTEQHSQPVTHHWIITVQKSNGQSTWRAGQIAVAPGPSARSETFMTLLNHIQQELRTDQFAVMFFSLAPDAI